MSTKIGPDEDASVSCFHLSHRLIISCHNTSTSEAIFKFNIKFKFGICLGSSVKFGHLVRSLLELNKGGALKPSLIMS